MRPKTIEELQVLINDSLLALQNEHLKNNITELVSIAKYYRDGERHNGKAFQAMKKEVYLLKAQLEQLKRGENHVNRTH